MVIHAKFYYSCLEMTGTTIIIGKKIIKIKAFVNAYLGCSDS